MIVRTEDFSPIKNLTKGSHKKIWFICDRCGCGVLQAYKNYLAQKEGKFCRFCRNKNSAKKINYSENSKKNWQKKDYKEKISKSLSIALKKVWDKIPKDQRVAPNKISFEQIKEKIEFEGYKILTLETEYKDEIKILCPNNHEFITTIGKWNNNRRCAQCTHYNRYLDHKKVIETNGFILLSSFDDYMNRTGHWKFKYSCKNGHIYEKFFNNVETECVYCFANRSSSKAEDEVANYIISLGFNIERGQRKYIPPYTLDIFIPEKNIAIEYCGLYWHSSARPENKRVNQDYHKKKLELCESKGIRLITIFEDEWLYKQDLTRYMLKYILGKEDKKIFARNCIIKEISPLETREFAEKYHIFLRNKKSKIKLGAFHQGELVALMTFSHPTISRGKETEQTWEIDRFCTKCSVIGIASKLLGHFKKNYLWKVIYSYADRRWSEGDLYYKLGFKLEKITKPSLWYVKNGERFHNYKFRGLSKTEIEQMKYSTIYDCGHLLFTLV
jgi:hypothetical protein